MACAPHRERAGPLSEESGSDGLRVRGKAKELLVNDRAANPDRASLHRFTKASPKGGEGIGGDRSSAESAPFNLVALLPEGRRAARLVHPTLDLRRGRGTGRTRVAHPGQRHRGARAAATGGLATP